MKKLYLLFTMLVQVSIVFSQTHFIKGFVGNGYEQMNLNIVDAKISGVKLQAGDEIAVFDGILCVGVLVLTQEVDSVNDAYIPSLTASAEEITNGISDYAGFKEGSKIYLRFWDKNAGIEYHNVVLTFIDQTTGLPTTEKPFTKAATYFVAASTSNTTTLTWVGGNAAGGAQNWSNINNWNPKVIPEPLHTVIIPNVSAARRPIIFAGTNASAGSLANNSILTIYSDDNGIGSLVVANGVSGTGTATGMRNMSAGSWHLISSPVSGVSISDFLLTNTNIPTKVSDRGLMSYNESSNNWNPYFTDASGGNIGVGSGYCGRIDDSGDPALNVITFADGTLTYGSITAPVTKTNLGWNLVGNPYSSAIYIKQEVFGFLAQNDAMLDASFKGIYLWDPTANAGSGAYTVVNKTEGQSNLAAGQGFFVKAASAGSVSFIKQMQVHQVDAPFKSATVKSPSVMLSARSNDISSTTKINFIGETTLGLDPGYDAGILRTGSGFDIYSRLVTDNGVDFMVQALPGKSSDNYVIPVGVDATKGGEIVFSANPVNLPVGYQLILEDKLMNSFTDLKNGEMYVANLTANSKGTGRFYLHVGAALQTGINTVKEDKLVVYTSDNTVYIKGDVGNNARFTVYTVDGRIINRFDATSQSLNQMNISGYTPGIYFISVQSQNKYKPVKFVVGK